MKILKSRRGRGGGRTGSRGSRVVSARRDVTTSGSEPDDYPPITFNDVDDDPACPSCGGHFNIVLMEAHVDSCKGGARGTRRHLRTHTHLYLF